MALHIKDTAAEAAVRRLANSRGVSLTDAIRTACQEAIARDARDLPIDDRLADIHARVKAAPETGDIADRAFFDQVWGETD